jgi:phage-related protein
MMKRKEGMKPYHEMTKREAVEHLRALYYAQLKEQVKILRHLRKHLERTVTKPEGVPGTGRKGRKHGKA